MVVEVVVDDDADAGPAGPSRGEGPFRDRWCCGVTSGCRVAVAVVGGRAVSRGWPPAGRGSPCFIREERPTPRPASGARGRPFLRTDPVSLCDIGQCGEV